MVQKKLPLINSAHGSETRNIINELIKLFNSMGYTYNEALQKAIITLDEAERINKVNNNTNDRLDNMIANSGTSSSEVVDARGTHAVLSGRLNATDTRTRWITPEAFGAIGNGIVDDTQALQDAFYYSHTHGLKVRNFDRNKQYNISKPIYIERWSDIDLGDAIVCKTTNDLGSGSNTYNVGTTMVDYYNKDAFFIYRHPNDYTCEDVKFKNVRLKRTAPERVRFGIYAPRLARFSFSNIWSLSDTTDYLLYGFQLYMADELSNLKQYSGIKTIFIDNDGSDLGGSTSLNFNHIVGYDQDGDLDLYGVSYSVINNPMIDRNRDIAFRFRSCPGVTINSPSIEFNYGTFISAVSSKITVNTPRVLYNQKSKVNRNLILATHDAYLTIVNGDIRDYEGEGDSALNMDLTILERSHVVLINTLMPSNGNDYRSLTNESTLNIVDKTGATYRDAQGVGTKVNNIRELVNTQPPTAGTWQKNETIINTNKTNGIDMWICTASGSPGTWQPIYLSPKKTKGVKQFTGDGENKTFTFPHELGTLPSIANVWPTGYWAGYYDIESVTYDATNIIITTKTVAASGRTLDYNWFAEE